MECSCADMRDCRRGVNNSKAIHRYGNKGDEGRHGNVRGGERGGVTGVKQPIPDYS